MFEIYPCALRHRIIVNWYQEIQNNVLLHSKNDSDQNSVYLSKIKKNHVKKINYVKNNCSEKDFWVLKYVKTKSPMNNIEVPNSFWGLKIFPIFI